MCGIIGYVGRRECSSILVEGLRRLDNRGYDSAGLALSSDGALHVRKRQGQLETGLTRLLAKQPLRGTVE